MYQLVGGSFDGTRDFKIFTPANMGSYGIPKGLDDFDGLIFIKVSQFEVVSTDHVHLTFDQYTLCMAMKTRSWSH